MAVIPALGRQRQQAGTWDGQLLWTLEDDKPQRMPTPPPNFSKARVLALNSLTKLSFYRKKCSKAELVSRIRKLLIGKLKSHCQAGETP
jgi:hypothetical protein